MKSSIVSEYEMIQRTTFWKELQSLLLGYMDNIKNRTMSDKDVNLSFNQGVYAGIHKSLYAPDELLRKEKAKSDTTQDNLGKGPSKSA